MTERWWNPDRHAARRPMLLARNEIKAALRTWFESAGFVEIETSALQISPGNETHLHAFGTELRSGDGQRQPMYLRTSPEFAAKKLLAAGEPRVFEFAASYRNGERTPLHAPEFTMLEWYRTEARLNRLIVDGVAIVRAAAEIAGTDRLRHQGLSIDPLAEPEMISVAEAFDREAGIDLGATLAEDGTGRRDVLAEAAVGAGVRIAADDNWSDIFSRVMAERIEPSLGRERISVLHGYPAPEAALASLNESDRRFAERFELFIAGVELANGCVELTDATALRERLEANMAVKQSLYGESYPIDADFIGAVAAMPPAAGVAMGFDRLIMLCVGAASVADVQWTPVADPFA